MQRRTRICSAFIWACGECNYPHCVLDLVEAEDWDQVAPFVGQLAQSLLQNQLDGGAWDVATGMVPTEDPCQQMEFAGAPPLLQDIVANRRAVDDLKERVEKRKKDA